MGVLGFEPRTSALSELRSSQLSYTPFDLLRAGAQKKNRGIIPPEISKLPFDRSESTKVGRLPVFLLPRRTALLAYSARDD